MKKLFTMLRCYGLLIILGGVSVGSAARAQASSQVTLFTLVNADTDQDIMPLQDGSKIVLSQTGSALNVRADVQPQTVGSVVFYLDGIRYVEGTRLYTLFGNRGNDYFPGTLSPGTHTLVAVPYGQPQGEGEAGKGKAIAFTVVEQANDPVPTTSEQVFFRINAGGGAVTTGLGRFTEDRFWTGATSTFSISNDVNILQTSHDVLYRTERTSLINNPADMYYRLPVPAGQYRVVLHFAELWWNLPYGAAGGEGSRLFDVMAEGQPVLTSFDLLALAPPLTAHTRTFLREVTDGQLDLRFISRENRATVAAIEVIRIQAAPTAQAGGHRTVSLPLAQLTIPGAGQASPGRTIAKYAWTKLDGPNVQMTNADRAHLKLTNLAAGTYHFRLTVTDNVGAKGTDEITLTVVAPPQDETYRLESLVLVNADTDQDIVTLNDGDTIRLAETGTALSVRVFSQPQKIGSVVFELGGRQYIENQEPYSMFGNMGENFFAGELPTGAQRLKVSLFREFGGQGTAAFTQTFALYVDDRPQVWTGEDQEVMLPAEEWQLGSRVEVIPGRTVQHYTWQQEDGPTVELVSPDAPRLLLRNLHAGLYRFRLTAQDNAGRTGSDVVSLLVMPDTNASVVPDPDPVTPRHRTWFVSTKGSDAQIGTQQAPWATLRHAIRQAAAGDTIRLAAGRYDEPGMVETNKSLAVIGAGREQTIIRWPTHIAPNYSEFSWMEHGLRFVGKPTEKVKGVLVRGMGFEGWSNAQGRRQNNGALFFKDCEDVKVEDIYATNFAVNAIWITRCENVEVGYYKGVNTSFGSFHYCFGQISFSQLKNGHFHHLEVYETVKRNGGYGITQIGQLPSSERNWIWNVLIEDSEFHVQPDNVWNGMGPNFSIELAGGFGHGNVEIRNNYMSAPCSFPGRPRRLDRTFYQGSEYALYFHHNHIRSYAGYGVEVGISDAIYAHNLIELLNESEAYLGIVGDVVAFANFKRAAADGSNIRENMKFVGNLVTGINNRFVQLEGGYENIEIYHNTMIFNNKSWANCEVISTRSASQPGRAQIRNNALIVQRRLTSPTNDQRIGLGRGQIEADHNLYYNVREMPANEGPHSERLLFGTELGFARQSEDLWEYYRPLPTSPLVRQADERVMGWADKGAVQITVTSSGRPAAGTMLAIETYPNPAQDLVNVSTSWENDAAVPVRLTLVDGYGKATVLDQTEALQTYTYQFSVAHLKPGVYYVHLQVGHQYSTQQLLKF